MSSLTVLVPFFNEERTLKESLNRLLAVKEVSSIILIDDCSTDSSQNIAKDFASNNQIIKYLRLDVNSGKGAALSFAKEYIDSKYVIVHDADLEYFPNDIVQMYSKTNGSEEALILGSRFVGKKKRRNVYIRTYLANKLMSLFFSLVFFHRISDVATCYKLLPSSFFKNIDIKEKGFSIEIEILSKFLKYSRNVIEVPIKYEGRSYQEGKKIKTVDGFFYLYNTIKYRFID